MKSQKEIVLANMPGEMQLYYSMIQRGLFDSVIQICEHKERLQHNDLYAIAVAYSFKNDRDSAYHYALKNVALNLNNLASGAQPYETVANCIFGYGLANDDNLERLVDGKISAYYSGLSYPKKQTGLELLRLAYLDQKARYMQALAEDGCYTDSCRQNSMTHMLTTDSFIQNSIMKLYETNGGYIGEEEAGPAAREQFTIIHHIANVSMREKLMPILTTAYEKKQIDAWAYVKHIVRTELFKKNVFLADGSMFRMEDSLCKKYNCTIRNVQTKIHK